jgi:signal transduction histidine kinase
MNVLGFKENELIGRSVLEIFPKENQSAVEVILKSALEGREEILTAPLLSKDGRHIAAETHIFKGHLDGRPVIYAVSRDTTSLLQARQFDQERDQLKETIRAKDRFLSIIAHDLRGPFNVILGFTELLEESLADGETEKSRLYCHTIHEASDQALRLLVNLLEWARSQSGGIAYNPEMLQAESQLREIASLLGFQAAAKNLEIKYEIEPLLEISGDRNMLRTVMINLISNAIKFSLPGNEIKVCISTWNKAVMFSVSDRGIGMRADQIENLFRPDIQVTTNGTFKETGTGMGLLLCKDFIEKHGGKIWAESEPGKGSCFIFTIPSIGS